MIICSKLELEKLVDRFRTENETLQLEVDFNSSFTVGIFK